MKRSIMAVLLAGVMLCGCGEAEAMTDGVTDGASTEAYTDGVGAEVSEDSVEQNAEGFVEEEAAPEGMQVIQLEMSETQETTGKTGTAGTEETEAATATVHGPYGSVSLTFPEGWTYEICNVDDDRLLSAEYGIQFSPANEEEGYIEVGYHIAFGVCGMGLEEVETTLAGEPALIGYFDGSSNWGFVSFGAFGSGHGGIVALSVQNDAWGEQELDESLAILDTLVYNAEEVSGAIGACEEDRADD